MAVAPAGPGLSPPVLEYKLVPTNRPAQRERERERERDENLCVIRGDGHEKPWPRLGADPHTELRHQDFFQKFENNFGFSRIKEKCFVQENVDPIFDFTIFLRNKKSC